LSKTTDALFAKFGFSLSDLIRGSKNYDLDKKDQTTTENIFKVKKIKKAKQELDTPFEPTDSD
jgi:hypothetical protein